MKNKSSSRKRRTPGEIVRMKTECSWQMKTRQLLQRKFIGVQPFIAANKTKLTKKTKTTDAPRKTHSA
jgi:hypothetical protein